MEDPIYSIIETHKSSGEIKDAYIKVYMDEMILNLNTFTLELKKIRATQKDLKIWNGMVFEALERNKKLQKEVNEFKTIFKLLNKFKIRSGILSKSECPDFVLERKNKKIGIEVTKIYVGYDWLVEKLSKDMEEYKLDSANIEGYIEYKKATDKVEVYNDGKRIILSPKINSELEKEYNANIKNKIFEKIRKLLDNYKKYDINIIFAEITSPEYFDDITDLEYFSKEIMYYIMHLEGDLSILEYRLIIKINKKWIEINLKNGTYKTI